MTLGEWLAAILGGGGAFGALLKGAASWVAARERAREEREAQRLRDAEAQRDALEAQRLADLREACARLREERDAAEREVGRLTAAFHALELDLARREAAEEAGRTRTPPPLE